MGYRKRISCEMLTQTRMYCVSLLLVIFKYIFPKLHNWQGVLCFFIFCLVPLASLLFTSFLIRFCREKTPKGLNRNNQPRLHSTKKYKQLSQKMLIHLLKRKNWNVSAQCWRLYWAPEQYSSIINDNVKNRLLIWTSAYLSTILCWS